MRSILLSAIFLLAAAGSIAGAHAQQTPASEIAPTGRLRVGFQTGSPILAKRAPDGSVSGVVVDLGKFIAEKLGVAFDPVVYAIRKRMRRASARVSGMLSSGSAVHWLRKKPT